MRSHSLTPIEVGEPKVGRQGNADLSANMRNVPRVQELVNSFLWTGIAIPPRHESIADKSILTNWTSTLFPRYALEAWLQYNHKRACGSTPGR